LILVLFALVQSQTLLWSDEFDEFDLSKWEHEITLSGGGNWEFEYYTNNRSNSYVRDSILYLLPTLTADTIGEQQLQSGDMNLWGSDPANLCTGNAFYGCERTGGGGGNIINPIQSARIRTAQSFTFKYGRIEVRAKLPTGDWIWPAIWMVPRYNSYGDWPASGEIDIVESRGNAAGYAAGGIDYIASTMHWGPYWAVNGYEKTHQEYKAPSGDFGSDFHVFGMSWDKNGLYTYMDDEKNVILNVSWVDEDFWTRGGWGNTYANPWLGRGNGAPFDQSFFIILNVAVGGTNGYFPDGQGSKPWSDTDPHAVDAFWNAKNQWYPTWKGEGSAMQIDYVHVYQS